ncbi:NAD(P)H-binding protein [Blastococcus sp. TF02A-26]|uniref:NAD(P)H-binding protein n=1 Tax=Blastococcus sp. TF02A-26 TaxID=2250577 RepID=UPI000DEA6026|nr:NAD(P)H-binding protein [Blastococcus sp. TF02A-26]RBY88439.1 SDR family NAD(P)-dependent oxidoreductase [Blastococcus sp. TF02A-26]
MTPANGPIAVTGATGGLGRRVAERLSAAGVDLRLVVRDAGRSRFLPGSEVVENPGGYADGDGFAAALDGVHTLYLVSAAEAVDRVEQHRTAVAAAARAGVRRVVYTSFLGAAPDSVFTLGRHHAATEEALAASGMAWTALRHSLYADFVPALAVRSDGGAVIAGPAGDGRASFVSRDDCADVAAAVLLDDSGALDGRAVGVTGPAAVSLAEAAAVLTEVSGIPVAYREETVEEAWASRRPSGHPDWEIEGWISSYTSIAAGEMAAVTDAVPSLTGHPARSLADQLRAHPGDFAHLR